MYQQTRVLRDPDLFDRGVRVPMDVGPATSSGRVGKVDGSQRCGQHHCEDGFPRVFPLDQEELDNCTGR